MKTGDILLIPFPFAELTNKKVRPVVVVCETKDKYKDIVVCAISSVLPTKLSQNEILLKPTITNQLRVVSVVKVDRIITSKKEDIILKLGKLSNPDLVVFKQKFNSLIDN